MTSMLVTVIAFAAINYALKSAGLLLLMERRPPDPVQDVIEAMPAAMLTGMLVASVLGERWAGLDPAVLVGLSAAAIAWLFRAPQLVAVAVALAATVAVRWLW
ncbi:AzlD domain-containing protein [Microbacterium sp.]|uniref:AzlD domain-containing protein n=1 Tax=Microbacterium sp. TaxID=51671 RepID=UPI003C747055